MAHYALLDENNVVTQVITGVDENDTDNLPEEFDSWEEFYKDQWGANDCKRTSYNTRRGEHILGGTPFRKQHAAPGYTYEADVDGFKPNQPPDQPNSTWDADNWTWVDPE